MERTVHQVGFRSSAFPLDPTEAERGDGPHGMALAFWVVERLEAAGLEPGEPVPEDWGWLLDVRGPGRVVVGCGAVDAAADEFSVTVEDAPRWLRRPDPEAPALVARVVAVLDGALRSDPAVADVAWEQGGPPGR